MTPFCECHGEPMLWNKDVRYSAGGFWRCRPKDRARQQAIYERDPLKVLMRQQLTHRRKRLAIMEARLNG